jgi:hypothetical protein
MKNVSFTGIKRRRVPLARCARVPRATGFASSWQGGSFAPRCIPETRSFAPWTTPRRSASGHLTGGDFALPTAPIDQAYAAMDLHEGYAPIDRSGAFAPLPHEPDGVPPRCPCPTVPIGCALPEPDRRERRGKDRVNEMFRGSGLSWIMRNL